MRLEDGEVAVRLARDAMESVTLERDVNEVSLPGGFMESRGVFVTINTHPDGGLRGCIGYPEPIMSLGKAIIKASEGACNDPRFQALTADELDHVVVEVSVLTRPEEVLVGDRLSLPDEVVVGRDGLIMEMGPFRGLLLPQVPVEWGWDSRTFLSQTCVKAGMTPDCWMDRSTKVYSFQAEVFTETSPRGDVVRKPLR